MSIFTNVKINKPRTNVFNLSHEKKMAMNMGELIPILCEEVVPGDTFSMNSEIMMRLAPMVAPIMHRVNVYTHSFFVPNRLLWDEWEDFITGGEDGEQMPEMPHYLVENLPDAAKRAGSLLDYMGYQAETGTTGKICALAPRAYGLIYNEYYRDQNLQAALNIPKGSGEQPDGTELYKKARCWEKDYFTSALPWTQRGGEVSMPVTAEWNPQYKPVSQINSNSTGSFIEGNLEAGLQGQLEADGTQSRLENLEDPQIANASNISINELRVAARLQEWLERNARAGSRYIEQILSHFGVVSSDARLQRPEFLGGGKSPVVISEVLQTSQTDPAESPQGNMAGHGITVGKHHNWKKRFEEHGYVITILSVLPKTSYQQGIRRHLLKDDKYEYYWPTFAHLGEQEVWESELYQSGAIDKTQTFGYQSRYSEYKYIPSSVHGEMRTDLDFWHMGRKFETQPNLNASFVASDPTHRIFASTDVGIDKLYVQIYNNIHAKRPMPIFGTPRL